MKRLLRSRDRTEFNFVEGRRLIQSSGMDRGWQIDMTAEGEKLCKCGPLKGPPADGVLQASVLQEAVKGFVPVKGLSGTSL